MTWCVASNLMVCLGVMYSFFFVFSEGLEGNTMCHGMYYISLVQYSHQQPPYTNQIPFSCYPLSVRES